MWLSTKGEMFFLWLEEGVGLGDMTKKILMALMRISGSQGTMELVINGLMVVLEAELERTQIILDLHGVMEGLDSELLLLQQSRFFMVGRLEKVGDLGVEELLVNMVGEEVVVILVEGEAEEEVEVVALLYLKEWTQLKSWGMKDMA